MTSSIRTLATALGLMALAAPVPGRSQDAAADAANGKRIYLAVGCFACHGRAGQGGNLNTAAPPLAQTQLPLEAFKFVLRSGPNDMPAYVEAVLPDRDAADLYAFVQSLPGRRPVKDIAILNR